MVNCEVCIDIPLDPLYTGGLERERQILGIHQVLEYLIHILTFMIIGRLYKG